MDNYTKCKFCTRALNKTLPEFNKRYRDHIKCEHLDEYPQWKLERKAKKSKSRSSSVSALSSTSENESNPPPVSPPGPAPEPSPVPMPEPQPAPAASEPHVCSCSSAVVPPQVALPKPATRTKSSSSSGYESLVSAVQNEPADGPSPSPMPGETTRPTKAPAVPEIEVITIDDSDSDSGPCATAALPTNSPQSQNVEAENPPTETIFCSFCRLHKIYCPFCGEEQPSEEALDCHSLITHIRPFKCNKCEADYPEEIELRQHVADAHPPTPPPPAPKAETLQRNRATAPTVVRRGREFITKIKFDGGQFWECSICRTRPFSNVSQHLSSQTHNRKYENFVNSDSDRPPAIIVIDRNLERAQMLRPPPSTSSSNPSTSQSSGRSGANSMNKSRKPSNNSHASAQIGATLTPLSVATGEAQNGEAQQLSLLSPVTSSDQQNQVNAQTFSYDVKRPFYPGTYLAEEYLQETDNMICLVLKQTTKQFWAYKCLKCGDETKYEEGARAHFRSAHPPKRQIKNLNCNDCRRTFDTKEAWKQDQLAHQKEKTRLLNTQIDTLNISITGDFASTPMMSPPISTTSEGLSGVMPAPERALVNQMQELQPPTSRKRSHSMVGGHNSAPASESKHKRSRSPSNSATKQPPTSTRNPKPEKVKVEKAQNAEKPRRMSQPQKTFKKLLVSIPLEKLHPAYQQKLLSALPTLQVRKAFEKVVLEACVKVVTKK